MFQNKKIRIFVRNKARYNPASKEYGFLHVDVANYAGTTIGNIKENVKKQCRNSLKLDDLFLNNEKLSDERSVAHYNLEDGTILESASNPFWVTCLFIKQYEVEQTKLNNPNDKAIQAWTTKSANRKKTLLSVLLNSKNEFQGQPPHFPTLDDFVIFLERLNKKGARMNPLFTQRDLQDMHDDFVSNFIDQSNDPLGTFIQQHAVRLGLKQQGLAGPLDNRVQNAARNNSKPVGNLNRNMNNPGLDRNTNNPRPARVVNNPIDNPGQKPANNNRGGRRKKERLCDDCEDLAAEVYCPECQNATGGQGLSLCQNCSNTIHRGATRRSHQLQDIDVAPKVTKPYVPHAFKAPFSILLALYSGMTETPRVLSMTEDEIKNRGQPLTDTDLSDKQNGRYVGGFECIENSLIAKHFVQREDSAYPTYALTESGHQLATKLFRYQQSVQRFLRSHDFPTVPHDVSTICGTRKVCLIIDEQERDKNRFLQLADQWGIDAQVRSLPAGDYIWILTPPLPGPDVKYDQRQPSLEKVLPFIVERKGWEDLDDSVRTKRFHKQVLRMLGCGLPNCFYLMEGSISSLRYRTDQQQQKLKDELENIFLHNGFYINYTASWFKSATWLKWFTVLLSAAVNKGLFRDHCLMYNEFVRRANVQPKSTVIPQTDFRQTTNTVWLDQQFIDNIFRESRGLQTTVESVKEELHKPTNKQLLILQGLEAYNKRRQTLQNKCLVDTHDNLENTEDLVQDRFTTNAYNMVHYDIMCYRQLQIQVFAHVYIVRTENNQDTKKIRDQMNNNNGESTSRRADDTDNQPADVDTEEFMMQQALAKSRQEETDLPTCTSGLLKKNPKKGIPSATPSRKRSPKTSKNPKLVNTGSSVRGEAERVDSEDEDLKRALELSRQCAYDLELNQPRCSRSDEKTKPCFTITTGNVPHSDTAIPTNVGMSDSQDEELQKILEMSKKEIKKNLPVFSSDSQDKELQRVLELSTLDQSPIRHGKLVPKCNQGIKRTFVTNDCEDKELQKVIKLSSLEQSFVDNPEQLCVDNLEQSCVDNLEELCVNNFEESYVDNSVDQYGFDTKYNVDKTVRNETFEGKVNQHVLDGAEEMRLALTQSYPSNQCNRIGTNVETLSEEEQIRLAIEQSKMEISVHNTNSIESKKTEIPVLYPNSEESIKTKQTHLGSDDVSDNKIKEDVILIDSQGTDYSDSCVEILDGDSPLESYCDDGMPIYQSPSDEQFEDMSQEHQRKACEVESISNKEDENVNHQGTFQIENSFQLTKTIVSNEKTGETILQEAKETILQESRETILQESRETILQEYKNDNGYDCELKGLDNVQVNNLQHGKVLVEDTQEDSDNEDLFPSINVPESTGLNDICTDEDDIDVIPPSPDKESPMTSKRLSAGITPKQSLKMITRNIKYGDSQQKDICHDRNLETSHDSDLETSHASDLETSHASDLETSHASDLETCHACDLQTATLGEQTQQSQSVSLLLGFVDDIETEHSNEGEGCESQYTIQSGCKLENEIQNGDYLSGNVIASQFKIENYDKIVNIKKETDNYSFEICKTKVKIEKEPCNHNVDFFHGDKSSLGARIKSEKILNEYPSMDSGESKSAAIVSHIDDEEFARKIQEQINRELEQEEYLKHDLKRRQTSMGQRIEKRVNKWDNKNPESVCLPNQIENEILNFETQSDSTESFEQTDEEMARQLQERLDKGYYSPDQEEITEKRNLRKRKHSMISASSNETHEPSETLISLQEVISQHDVEENIRIKLRREQEDLELAQTLLEQDQDQIGTFTDQESQEKRDLELAQKINNNDRVSSDDNDQWRIQQEKADEELARKLADDDKKETATNSVSSQPLFSQHEEDNYPMLNTQAAVEQIWDRRLKAIQRSKTDLQTQLQEVRQSQNVKYRGHSGSNFTSPRKQSFPETSYAKTPVRASTSSNSSFVKANTSSGITLATRTFDNSTKKSPKTCSSSWQPVSVDGDSLPSLSENDAITISPPHSPVEKKKPFSFTSASSAAGNPHSSQPIAGTSYINQNTSLPFKHTAFDSSQSISSSISSSQISGNMANVTCGNCHQKGHNRKWPQCPNYHSYEETQRRQKQEDDKKKRIEDEQHREQQTRDELERHKTTLTLIAAQIEQEKDGLDRTIKKMTKKGKKRK
ncbi:uncharacterized protein LOC134693283 [Mytilus trossulus]|uniref:uncharacterized protein LOC134693283 n=1 Tax=Mytilus trossulus TaxID=6551 RepID=UPI0030058291